MATESGWNEGLTTHALGEPSVFGAKVWPRGSGLTESHLGRWAKPWAVGI